jgi:type I restriction enzyme M protein
MPVNIADFDPIDHPDIFAIDGDRIVYLRCQRHGIPRSYVWSDPEEKVRAWFYYELITTFSYPPERIDLEVEVYRRKPEDFADLVVYKDDALREPFLAAECKAQSLPTSGFEQAVKQAWGNANNLAAPFACTTTGLRTVCFDARSFSLQDRERLWINLPERYGEPIKYKFVKGDPDFDLRRASLNELRTKFQQCHDVLWEGGKRNPAQAFDEMTKLMFCKLQDERGGTYDGDPYGFQVGSNETASEVGARIRGIFDKYKIAAQNVFRSSFDISDQLISRVAGIIQEISLYKSDLDAKGKAFEKFLDTVFRGDMGQYFTPRSVVQFMVEVVRPSIRDKMIDPACGSGGFLLYALERVQRFAEQRFKSPIEQRDYWRDWSLRGLYGIEINDQISRVAMMGMILHEDGHSNIVAADGLLPFDSLARANAELRPATFHKLLTNPPFGSKVIRVADGAPHYLDLYTLGRGKNSQRTELLFLERCLDLLVPGGRMGIVIPKRGS